MRLSDFKFRLPEKLIAQEPIPKRDRSRLLVLNREEKQLYDCQFADIIHFFRPGDALILNETKVFPARLFGQKDKTDARIEVFLLRELNDSLWEVLVRPARKVRTGNTIWFTESVNCEVVDNTVSGGRVVRFICNGHNLHDVINEVGESPLPPYIKRQPNELDKKRYQTVYAKTSGAVAAPTAGLHFTHDLLQKVQAKGVDVIPILLHVGLGTFRPVAVEDLSRHRMDSEFFEINAGAAEAINRTIARGGRIFAVGTTTTRALETVANFTGGVRPDRGWTDIFIYPPYSFRVVDGLITNFHLPGSTLIMLVSAFADKDAVLKAYRHAIRKKYRFYSYGDAMLII